MVAHHYPPEVLFGVRLALEEAIVNAIKHGNRMDCQKKVHVEADITPKRARLVVEDEGCGFRRERVPDPRLEENLTKCTGRGILLIEAYMNQVKWSHGGRRLEMIRTNPAAAAPKKRPIRRKRATRARRGA